MNSDLAWGAGGLLLATTAVVLAWALLSRRPALSGAAAQPAVERRQQPRRAVGGVTIQVADAEAAVSLMTATVLDCSVAGIGLRVDEPLALGSRLSLRPVGVPGNTTWALVEVKHATRKEDHWKIGCRFIRTPAWVASLYST